jgi:biopolymer transport protein ExbB
MSVSKNRADFRFEVNAEAWQMSENERPIARENVGLMRRPIVCAAGIASILVFVGSGAGAPAGLDKALESILRQAGWCIDSASAWYNQTPPMERISWGGLAVCVVLGSWVFLERAFRLRRSRVLPARFVARFLERLREGKLDRAKGLDLCALNPSPAARVAQAALDRWGRSTADLERAVALTSRVESGRLWRSVGTLRRIAALAPLLGLLGALGALSRLLASAAALPVGPELARALNPLIAGVTLAIVALAAYDGLVARVEALIHALNCLGAETVDPLAMIASAEPRTVERLVQAVGPASQSPVVRTPHQVRSEAPGASSQAKDSPGHRG